MNLKLISKVVGVAMVLSFAVAGAAAPAQAVTVQELQAQIDALLAQLASLSGGTSTSTSTSTCFNYTRDLTVGSTGADVVELQKMLVAKGALTIPTGVSMGYFGTLTKSALATYQASAGITPSVGYFGSISRGHAAANCSTSPSDDPDDSGDSSSKDLKGTFGEISDVNNLSQYSSEEVGDGQNDVTVLGMEVEAGDDGDIELTSIKVEFDPAGNASGDSDKLRDYVDSVDIYLGGEMVGSADVKDFSENTNIFTKSVALKNAIVRAGKTEKVLIKVNAISNFDSGDIDSDSWEIDLNSIRFVDGSDAVVTDSTTGDLPSQDVAIDFVSFSTASNTDLKFSTASDSPKAGIVIVDDISNTTDVVLLKGKIKVTGSSDVVLDELPVTLTTVGGSQVSSVTGSIKLKIDGKEYTESVFTTAALTGSEVFDNLNLTLDAGETYDFEILADINDIDTGTLDEGDTILASITASNREVADVENEDGDQLTSSEKTGTATGEAQEFRTNGISLELISTSNSVADGGSANDDLGTVKITFKVTAIGDTAYVSSLADALLTGVTTGKTTVHADRAGVATVAGVSVSIKNVTDTTLNAAGLFEIEEGQSETFELTTTIALPTAGDAGLFNVDLGGVSWTTTSTDETPDNAYTSNLDAFTEDVTLN